jgi:parallel beta-helix repeat protein
LIVDSTIQNNTKFGILSVQSPGSPVIQNNTVSGTHSWGPDSAFGDGIATVLSPMSRPLHLEYPGSFWHVTQRGNEQRVEAPFSPVTAPP